MLDNQSKLSVDFSSDYRLSGWAYDPIARRFPEELVVRCQNGDLFPLSSAKRIFRADVCDALGLPAHLQLGFDINILDVFNNRIAEYSIERNDSALWSRQNYISSLLSRTPNFEMALTHQKGSRQVVLIYKKQGCTHHSLAQIHGWSASYFDKAYQSGVSFMFVSLEEFAKLKSSLLAEKSTFIFILESDILHRALQISPSLIGRNRRILIGSEIRQEIDWNGLLSSLMCLTGIPQGAKLTPDVLITLLTGISGYANLFFDSALAFYSFQSGKPKRWMRSVMIERVQESATEDVVVLSDRHVLRLSDFDPENCAIFVRSTSLQFFVDSLALEPIAFLMRAYKRGAKVAVIERSDAE